MPALPLRTDFDARSCRLASKHAGDASQARRLLSIAAIYDGASRGEAAGLGSVTVQIVCDWVKKFNAHGPDGLINRKAPGKPPKLTAEQLAALAAIVESGPIPASHGVVRWRIIDLCQWIWDEFRVSVSEDTVSRQLRAMGYRKLSARPRHHAQAQGAMEDFKKVSRGSWRKSRSKRTSPPA
jgi:transposase